MSVDTMNAISSGLPSGKSITIRDNTMWFPDFSNIDTEGCTGCHAIQYIYIYTIYVMLRFLVHVSNSINLGVK